MPFDETWEDGQTAHDDWLNAVENMLNRLEVAVNALGTKLSDIYQYRFNATAGNPGVGQVKYDAPPPATTKLFISEQTDDGIDISTLLNDWEIDDYVYIQNKTDADNNDKFQITSTPTIFADYIECTVDTVESVGTDFAGGAILSLIRVRKVVV